MTSLAAKVFAKKEESIQYIKLQIPSLLLKTSLSSKCENEESIDKSLWAASFICQRIGENRNDGSRFAREVEGIHKLFKRIDAAQIEFEKEHWEFHSQC